MQEQQNGGWMAAPLGILYRIRGCKGISLYLLVASACRLLAPEVHLPAVLSSSHSEHGELVQPLEGPKKHTPGPSNA